MSTDWKLIKDVVNAAIDSCERIEGLGYNEAHRDLFVDIRGQHISVSDLMTSSWTLPENVRYEVIRQRHDQNVDLPYVPESARILNAAMAACVEMIGSGNPSVAEKSVRQLVDWYRDILPKNLEQAMAQGG